MKRLLSFILAVVMALGAVVFTASAEGTLEIGKYQNGMENWDGSPNKGNRSAVTQILFIPYYNGEWRPDLFYPGLSLQVKMENATFSKTFDAQVATVYNGGSWGICRIEPCLLEGDNKFVPEKNVYYDATFYFQIEGEDLAATEYNYILTEDAIDPDEPTLFDAGPMYGEIENIDGLTCFIVKAPNETVMDPLENGEFDLKVRIREENSGEEYVIARYYFDHPGIELYRASSYSFFRLAVCEYGIVPTAEGVYTVELEISCEGEILYYGASDPGAFDQKNNEFMQNGAIVPEVIPHPYDEIPRTVNIVDPSGDGDVSIDDVAALLDCLAGRVNPFGHTGDLTGSGGADVDDVTMMLDLLSAGALYVRNQADNGWILKYSAAICGDAVLPAEYMGEPVTHLDERLFENCYALHTLFVPAGVTWIPERTFAGCGALDSVHYGGKKSVFCAGGAVLPAGCRLICDLDDDMMDLLDFSGASQITDLGGYQDILRVKTTGELLFSPNLNELRNLISAGHSYDEFTGYLRFTDSVNTYETVTAPPKKSKGAWVDFFLQGENIDCGFCPTAGVTYEIELAIAYENDPERVIFFGTYTATAPSNYADSPYYAPTPAGAGEERTFLLRYIVEDGGGALTGAAEQYLKKDETGTPVTAVPDAGYDFLCWSDGVASPERTDVGSTNRTLKAYFVPRSSGNIASVYIMTFDGQPILQKEYEDATLMIRGASNDKYNVTLPMTIKGRGNSSWNASASQTSYDSKNSYSIKLNEKAQLLGIGDSKSKKWVLNANKFDASGLRNYLIWELADRMGTIGYATDCTWVQLYVNMKYRGMYMLTEKIDTGKDRVNVNDDKTGDPDKGYLMELDFRGQNEEDPWFDIKGYGPNPAQSRYDAVEFVIKSDIEGQQDIDFIQDYVQCCHDALMSGDREAIDALVDIPSLIDMYIIEELSKDCDAGRASFYICKDRGGKLYFTAPWDFDFGFGTYGPAQTTTGLVSQGSSCCTWFAALINCAWFREEVAARLGELGGALEDTLSTVAATGEFLRADADRNAQFWNLWGRNYHGYVSYQVSGALSNYDEHIDFILDWTRERWQNLCEIFA